MDMLKNLLTGKDNATYDFVRVIGVLALVTFLALSIASFVLGRPWDGVAFGTGFGVAVASVAGALKLKETTEPDAPPAPSEPKA